MFAKTDEGFTTDSDVCMNMVLAFREPQQKSTKGDSRNSNEDRSLSKDACEYQKPIWGFQQHE